MSRRFFSTSFPQNLLSLTRGDRVALARAITLVESTLSEHRAQARGLLAALLKMQSSSQTPPSSNYLNPAFRIGLSGPPGVGKSTMIETFGMHLISRGHKVAVLAVDPSSSRTGGSILGDKTRMYELSRHPNAFIRPSPSSGSLGGVARNTNEAILLCESAGYDVVLVETVGVGQSETMVADMVDMFTLLVPPGGGDELQGLKKGIVELADMILINKADGDLALAAQATQIEYVSALKLLKPMNPRWRPKVIRISSKQKTGIEETWDVMLDFYKLMKKSGDLDKKRSKQRKTWMWRQIMDGLTSKLKADEEVRRMVDELEVKVDQNEITSGDAADKILKRFLQKHLIEK